MATPEPGKIFGEVLKEVRRERGLTQEQLAERSGCHRAHVSWIERQRRSPTVDMIFQLARGLDVTPSELILRVERKIINSDIQERCDGNRITTERQ